MRKLVVAVVGLLVAIAPFGAQTASADPPDSTCVTIPVVNQRVCVPPAGVPSVPQLPMPPTIPVPPLPTLPTPNLPQLPVPNLPQLPALPPAPLPDLPSVPTPALPPIPQLPTVPQLPGTEPMTAAASTPSALCSVPGVAGQVAGQPVQTALTGALGKVGACTDK